MKKKTKVHVGMDVHKDSVMIAVLPEAALVKRLLPNPRGVSIIGIALPKHSFQVHGAKSDGSVVYRKKLSRGKVLTFLASQPSCTVAMEAYGSAHYWGREIVTLGHEVRLVPPIYVKPFVKRQKNDSADAEGDLGSGTASDHALRGGQDRS